MLVLLLLVLVLGAAGMPYQVPTLGRAGGRRTLVVLGDMSAGNAYSLFFEALERRGHSLSFAHAAHKLVLSKYGQYLYDNLVLFAPSMEKHAAAVVDFTENGGNLIIAVDHDTSAAMRALLATFGVDLDNEGSAVIDHFSFEPTADESRQHTAVLTSNVLLSRPFLGDLVTSLAPVLYSGVAHSVNPDNVFATKIVRGGPSAYSALLTKTPEDTEHATGAPLLVTALQARNNARILVSGSLSMFSNAFFRAKDVTGQRVGNEGLCAELSKWALAETAVLRFGSITHHTSAGLPPDIILHEKDRPDLPQTLYPDPELTRNSLVYRIKDEIVYSMLVEEWTGGEWRPFYATDMQMEFVMMDPYVRKNLTADASGRFSATFTAPDDYGIFKFRVLYRRPGYSVLHAETQVSLRPFKHNEYDRFLLPAYPYYSSALACMIAFVVFSVFFLYSEDEKPKSKQQ